MNCAGSAVTSRKLSLVVQCSGCRTLPDLTYTWNLVIANTTDGTYTDLPLDDLARMSE